VKHSAAAALTPAERTLRARVGAFSLHAQRDVRETTQIARETFLARFEHLVDPDRVLDPDERRRRAAAARSAYFTRLAFLSVRARGRRPFKESA